MDTRAAQRDKDWLRSIGGQCHVGPGPRKCTRVSGNCQTADAIMQSCFATTTTTPLRLAVVIWVTTLITSPAPVHGKSTVPPAGSSLAALNGHSTWSGASSLIPMAIMSLSPRFLASAFFRMNLATCFFDLSDNSMYEACGVDKGS